MFNATGRSVKASTRFSFAKIKGLAVSQSELLDSSIDRYESRYLAQKYSSSVIQARRKQKERKVKMCLNSKS